LLKEPHFATVEIYFNWSSVIPSAAFPHFSMDLSHYSTGNSKCATKIIPKWFALIKTNIFAAQNSIF